METTPTPIHTIAIAGGTGKEGKGLAYRWLLAGYRVIIGSRQAEKAEAAATELRDLLRSKSSAGAAELRELNRSKSDAEVLGLPNPEAAEQADLVVLTVPFSAHRPTLEGLKPYLQGKTLIDVTVPLVPPKVTKVQMPPAGSAAQEAQMIVGEGVQVVAAFQSISYEKLLNDEEIDCDVLVCGGNKAARAQVLELVRAAGMFGLDAGPIENSVVAEGLTSILIGINKQYGVKSSGIRITGIPREPSS
jgi:NADPH-dependent F420 reductase